MFRVSVIPSMYQYTGSYSPKSSMESMDRGYGIVGKGQVVGEGFTFILGEDKVLEHA